MSRPITLPSSSSPPASAPSDTRPAPRRDSAIHLTLNTPGNQAFLTYLFTPGSYYRAPVILETTSYSTLLYGINALDQRIFDLIGLDIQMHHAYVSLLSDKQFAKLASPHTGFEWSPMPYSTISKLDRDMLEKLLALGLEKYDEVAMSVRRWKNEVDRRIGKSHKHLLKK